MGAGTFYGTNGGKVTGSGTKVNSNNKGKLRCLIDQVFVSGTALDAGSIMYVGVLPKGAVVLYSRITPIAATGIATAMSNAVTGTIGITGDTDLFGTFTTLAAVGAATQNIKPTPDGTIYAGMNPLTENKSVFITTADAEVVATEGVRIEIYYVVD